ncbi:MAG: wax ester/triacylglycerol synthase family O-acyltransferase [Nocardioides sp.]|nr:wax ester/triacylglycerol synthase family O-acyltransferase [Nocardioides sp.]
MPAVIDPTSTAFLLAESRSMPMHVGGLQLFEPPAGAGPGYAREMYEQMRDAAEISPLFRKHPARSLKAAGQLVWKNDDDLDIEHHVRHSALPAPGRVRELLELCSRLHSTRLAHERPLWEAHVIEGLDDGRIALYTKLHHALVDGVSAMRLMASTLTGDEDRRDMPAPWATQHRPTRAPTEPPSAPGLTNLAGVTASTVRSALAIATDAAGLPGAFTRTMVKGLRNETSAVSFHAPRTILNRTITGSRRFAAQDWPVERLKAVGAASGTTLNDVVLAMCAGALRSYLLELDALPEAPLIAMVPVSLGGRDVGTPSADGGNSVGSVMCQLATHLDDPARRLGAVHTSMKDGKKALATMSSTQVLAMSALGLAPVVVNPLLRLQGIARPPFNLVISNVPGPRTTQYWNGARLVGAYPLSIPVDGMGLNITCTSYDGQLAFGLTGCRRTVPSLQRMLTHLDDELAALEKAVGV